MSGKYIEDELLQLSGIQHYAFCRRQWALVYVENQWCENLFTQEGKQLHERVDNPDFFESRGGILTARSVPVSSYKLGFSGIADMVEFYADNDTGILIKGRKGKWQPIPVEYKRGKPKQDIIDEVQLCAQAMCLEEMLNTNIEYGQIYYGETKHRIKVVFNEKLREQVSVLSKEMHDLFNQKYTPRAEFRNKCKECSLIDICLPKLQKRENEVKNYIKKYLE